MPTYDTSIQDKILDIDGYSIYIVHTHMYTHHKRSEESLAVDGFFTASIARSLHKQNSL